MNEHLEQFRSLPDADSVKGLAAWFIRAHHLPEQSQYGVNWGVALPAKMGGDQLRVNVGAQHAFYAEYFDDGWWCFVYVPRNDAVDRVVKRFGAKVAVGPGQMIAPMREQLVVVGRASTIAELLRDPEFFEQSAALVAAFRDRKLPKADRTNDDTAELILDTPVDALRRPAVVIGVPYFATEAQLERSEPAWRLKHLLGRELQRRGMVAHIPDDGDTDWDLSWRAPDHLVLIGITVIAGMSPGDEERALRAVLGSMFRRAQPYRPTEMLLAVVVDRAPVDPSWYEVFTASGMALVAATHVPAWLDRCASTNALAA